MKPASSIGWRATAAALIALGLAHGAAAETITVTHWGAAFYGAPYAVAMQKGFFKQRGVDITGVLTSTGGGTSVRNTLAGDLPYGEVALSAAVEAIRAGQPLKIVCAGAESIADILWIARPDSPLNSIQDIVGKKIGYTSPGSVTNMLILMAMKAQGIDPSSVTLVPAGGIGANLTAFLSGAIDAGMTGEPVWSQERSKVKPVFWTKDVLPPDMTQSVGIVTDELAKAGPEKIRAIIEGRRQGGRHRRPDLQHRPGAHPRGIQAFSRHQILERGRAELRRDGPHGRRPEDRRQAQGADRLAESHRRELPAAGSAGQDPLSGRRPAWRRCARG